MYARSIKISFKDKVSKEMFINFIDNKADSQGMKNRTLLKFIFDNSDRQATLFLVLPDYKTYKKDNDNLAGPIMESFSNQGLKVDLNDGEIIGLKFVSSNYIPFLKEETSFYDQN